MENKASTYFCGGVAIMAVIELKLKEKVYKKRKSSVSILNNFSLLVDQGEKIAVVGKSGAGKSSLLNILGLLDKNYSGSYSLLGRNVDELSASELAVWRNEKLGFVLQESALINSLRIEDNIKLPFLYKKVLEKEAARRNFDDIVDAIGIRDILRKKPLECSGGEKARAVFARAIMMNPQIILADEPTASLDPENKQKIIDLLFDLNKEFGTTLITVTHDLEVANQHDRVIQLEKEV